MKAQLPKMDALVFTRIFVYRFVFLDKYVVIPNVYMGILDLSTLHLDIIATIGNECAILFCRCTALNVA